MRIFMNTAGHKYAAEKAASLLDCLVPVVSDQMYDVLDAASPNALNDEVLAETITLLKNSPQAEKDEFYQKLQEKRDARKEQQT